jgi:hypothetical protein
MKEDIVLEYLREEGSGYKGNFFSSTSKSNTYLKSFSLELNIFFWRSTKMMSSSIIRHLKCRMSVCPVLSFANVITRTRIRL